MDIMTDYWLWNTKTKSNRNKLNCKLIRIKPDEEYFNTFNSNF